MRKKLMYIFILFFVFMITACSIKPKETETKVEPEKIPEKEIFLDIVTTNKLLYNMVKDIVKERNSVGYMLNNKEDLFDFSYSQAILDDISEKDIFFYVGNGMEPWVDDFVDKLSKNKVSPVNISRGVKIIPFEREHTYKDKTIKDNPYFWVSVNDYKIAMLNIKNAIQDKDTKNRDIYEQNFSDAIKEVDEYDKKLKDAAGKLKDYTFIVDNDELDYFVKNYNLKYLKIYNYGLILTEDDNKKISEVEEKIAGTENVVFLYDSIEKLNANKALIDKYNLQTCNIIVYNDNLSYTDMLKSNLESLERLIVDTKNEGM